MDRSHRRRLGILSLFGPHLHEQRTLYQARTFPRPQIRSRHDLHCRYWIDLLRVIGTATSLPPGPHGLPSCHRGPRDGSSGNWHDGRHACGRSTDQTARYPPAFGGRPRPDRLVVLQHDWLDARRFAGRHRPRRLGPGSRAWLSVCAAQLGHFGDAASGAAHRGRRCV